METVCVENTSNATEKFQFLEIHPSWLYSRIWMEREIPGMHTKRIQVLEKKHGLVPFNTGSHHAPFVYVGQSILDAMHREALSRLESLYVDDSDDVMLNPG